MTKEQDYNRLEGIIVKAIQATKAENSGLVADIKGDMRVFNQKLTDYIDRDDKWKETYAKEIKSNTDFRLTTTGGLVLLKVIIGTVGIGTVISLVKLFTRF